MPQFTITSPSGRSYQIEATSIDHANAYVARRYFSGFEDAGNVFDEENARLAGPLVPAEPAQDQQPSWQDFIASLEPSPTSAEGPLSPIEPAAQSDQSSLLPAPPPVGIGPTRYRRPQEPMHITDRLVAARANRIARLRQAALASSVFSVLSRYSRNLRGS